MTALRPRNFSLSFFLSFFLSFKGIRTSLKKSSLLKVSNALSLLKEADEG